MKKKGFIAGVLVLSTLLMGTGYAYWTDSLNIKTTATTGDLKVKLLDVDRYGQYDGCDKEYGWSIIDGVPDSAISKDFPFLNKDANGKTDPNVVGDITSHTTKSSGYNTVTDKVALTDTNNETLGNSLVPDYAESTIVGDTMKVDLTNLYPGYAAVYQADIANIGSVAAKLSSIKTEVTGTSADTKGMIGISLYIEREYASSGTNGTTQGHVDVFKSLNINTTDTFLLGGVKFVRLSALEKDDVKAQLDGLLANKELFVTPDNNRMDIYYAVAMDPDAVGKYTTGITSTLNNKMNDSLTQKKLDTALNITFLWDQFNASIENPNVTNAKENLLVDQNSDKIITKNN